MVVSVVSTRIQVFLSCLFDQKDYEVVNFFTSILRSLNIDCVNIDIGDRSTHPEKARELISNSHALIAIATRKDEIRLGVFSMPKAIEDEMAMAYGLKKPILLFIERGVDTTYDFTLNYCTYLEFDRESLLSLKFLEKTISLVHNMGIEITPSNKLQRTQKAATILQDKFEGSNYDVFLCYNSEDIEAVKQIGGELKKLGILPWFDEWQLRPGLPWQRLLEEQIGQIKSAAVFVGANGVGPWQKIEIESFLREFVIRGSPVIPVLLPAATKDPKLPIFLKCMTWVDFRKNDPNPMKQLLWGITGRKPEVASLKEKKLYNAQKTQENVFSESTRYLIELIDHFGSFTWRYSQTRRLRFLSNFTDPISASVWAEVPTKANESEEDILASGILWSYGVDGGNKQFSFKPTVEKMTLDCCLISFDVNPKPEANDVLQYHTIFESPYLNPVYLEDIRDKGPHVTVNGTAYSCFEGFTTLIRTQDAKIMLRFPSSLGLKPENFAPFAASYTTKFDYLVESEMKRMTVAAESFGGNIFIEISIQNPLLHHIYGVAWNPPKKP